MNEIAKQKADLSEAELMTLTASVEHRRYSIVKTILDGFLAWLMLLLLSPVFFVLIVGVRLSSPGPILYSTARFGLNGKRFSMYKFRSMRGRTPAEILMEQRTVETQGFLNKNANDSRVTTFGRFIRSTSLDELPQIVNVALGHMSFVGPRPVMPQMTKPFPNFQSARLLVKPGITGLWQIRDRQNSSHVSFMWEHDLEYVRTYSFVVDTWTLLRTLPSVILKRGAY